MKLSELFYNLILQLQYSETFSVGPSEFKEIELDFPICLKILKTGGINIDAVLSRLQRIYRPTTDKNKMIIIFHNSNCLQFRSNNYINFKNLEAHKLLSDLYFCNRLLPFNNKIRITFKQLKMNQLEIPYYSELLRGKNLKVSEKWSTLKEAILFEYPLKDLLAKKFYKSTKRRSLRRKILRYYFYIGRINHREFMEIVKK